MNRRSGKLSPQNVIPGRFGLAAGKSAPQNVEQVLAGEEINRGSVDLAAMLKQSWIPPASPGFANRVLKRATCAANPPRKRWAPLLAAGSAASFFAVLLSATIFDTVRFDSPPEHSAFEVTVGDEVRTVRIAIDSVRPIDDVKMTIALSDNLQLYGYRGQHEVSWNARLEQGVNVISLPVSAIEGGDGEIIARIALDDMEKVFRIRTRYQTSGEAHSRDSRYVRAGCLSARQCTG